MKEILRAVSRSFYLTIRFLPRPLREPVGLAYLLARTTDTIADTATIPAEIRLTTLRSVAQVIAGETEFAAVAESLRNFSAQQTDAAERTLIENFARCLARLHNTNAEDRADIRAVLQTIVRGQELDLQRFGSPNELVALKSAADLDEYTYLVAGCVGEFWTRLGFRHLPRFAKLSPNEMEKLGVDYGKGLQLINVLRDAAADAAAGRDYLPADELALAPRREVFARWLARAEKYLSAGIDYSASLTNWRTRFATALPALIGARTIALLRGARDEVRVRRIKITRREVRAILFVALFAARSPTTLRGFYQRMERSVSSRAK